MILIYDNSNPIMASLLSAAWVVMESNYSRARFPCLGSLFLPVPQRSVHSCSREFGGPGARGAGEGEEGLSGLRSGGQLHHWDEW